MDDWSFIQAHFDSAIVRKSDDDVLLQNLQDYAKNKASAGNLRGIMC
jgi:hypothetical protein